MSGKNLGKVTKGTLAAASVEEQLACARAVIFKNAPYLMTLVYGLIPKACPPVGTLAVTKGMVMLYNPEFVTANTETRLAAGLMHEVQHILRDHLTRGETVPDPALFNIAGDLPINEDLKQAGWDTSDDWFYPDTFQFQPGLTAEDYYEMLQKQQEQQQKQQKGKTQGTGTEGEAGGSGGDGDKDKQKQGVGRGHCGGCSGNPGEGEDEQDEKDDGQGPAGRTEVDKKRIIDETCEQIKAAAQKGRGSVPGWLKELADKVLMPPKVPWQRKVQRAVKKSTGQIVAGGLDYSMSRPNKRSYVRGLVRPSMIECTPEICFIIDTSGSMDIDTQIRDAIRETCGCMKACGVDTAWVIQADVDVKKAKRMRINGIRSMPIEGRGGTSFIESIDVATKLRPRPNLIIYMTDGDGEAPERPPPGMDFIWCLVPSHWARPPAKWGHIIVVEDGIHPFENGQNDF